MQKTISNFLNPGPNNRDFPLDCETLEAMQSLSALAAIIGNIAGDKVVLYGCEQITYKNAPYRKSGYVFVRTDEFPEGEVLPWAGGPTSDGMYVKQENVKVTANDTEYPWAYTRRRLEPGVGDGRPFDWSEFTDIETIPQLMARNRSLSNELRQSISVGVPVGVVQMWAGSIDHLPQGYVLCDGRELPQADYPELFAAIGTTFNNTFSATEQYAAITTPGHFRVPDLRGRFIAGCWPNSKDYSEIGAEGGQKLVALGVDELPNHSHDLAISYRNVALNTGGSPVFCPSSEYTFGNFGVTTSYTGAGQAHENRPPYFVLAYIIKANNPTNNQTPAEL